MIPRIPKTDRLDDLTRLINDRLERIFAEMSKPFRATADLDMSGFLIRNLGSPKLGTDAARLADVGRLSTSSTVVSPELLEAAVVGLHADRAGTSPSTKGRKLFYETDRAILYANVGGAWVYASGTMAGTLSPDTKPTDLTTTDQGFLFQATDYGHTYRWNGSAWQYAPGDGGSGYIVAGFGNGGIWALCDGSATNIAQSNGTIALVTTPDITSDVFLQGASTPSAVKVATRATWEAAAKVADESAHQHVFNNGGTPTGGPVGSATTVQSGTGASVASSSHYHNDTSADYNTGPGFAHSHALTDALSQLKKFDETAGGLPKRIALAWYMRR